MLPSMSTLESGIPADVTDRECPLCPVSPTPCTAVMCAALATRTAGPTLRPDVADTRSGHDELPKVVAGFGSAGLGLCASGAQAEQRHDRRKAHSGGDHGCLRGVPP
jgi:hypothetical protein